MFWRMADGTIKELSQEEGLAGMRSYNKWLRGVLERIHDLPPSNSGHDDRDQAMNSQERVLEADDEDVDPADTFELHLHEVQWTFYRARLMAFNEAIDQCRELAMRGNNQALADQIESLRKYD